MRAPKKPKPEATRRWQFNGIAPRLLVKGKEDERGHFFLALALVFNDLKGLAYLAHLAKVEGERPAGEVTPEAGDQNGLQLQITRYVVGLLHELLVLLAKHRSIVDSEELHRLINRTPAPARECWEALVDVALRRGTDAEDQLRSLLARIRNNLAYHFWNPHDLTQGFERHFFTVKERTGHNRSARYSFGNTMAATRLFYADAAAQAGIFQGAAADRIDDPVAKIKVLAEQVNWSLRYLIEAFIDERERAAGLKPRSTRPRR